MSSSESVRSEREKVPSVRPLMSVRLFNAAINGNMILPTVPEEQPQDGVSIVIGQYPTDQSELESVTHSGDTVLHLLVTNRHNNLALKVFESDRSLLEEQNMMLETPLHCAANVGNSNIIARLISSCPSTVKNVLRETNKNRDTALHVAAKHGHKDVGHQLMVLSQEVAYKVNNKMLSPLNIAIVKENFEMVQKMLDVDPTLACTPFSDEMFPVHVAVRMGQKEMVIHFIENYPDYAKLRDPRGRNLLHIAAEEDQRDIFRDLSEQPTMAEMLVDTDYEGKSLLHIAAMKGHTSIMRDIWKKDTSQGEKTDNQGLTPLDLFVRQLRATAKVVDYRKVDDYLASTVDLDRLSHKWFDNVMQLSLPNKWERTQVIGLGSVLIITVTFAATFTIPGGYKQNDGTPVLVKKYMFRAFIMANTLAFMYGFLSLYILFKRAAEGQPGLALKFSIDTFMLSASSMVLAFGSGVCLMLASDCLPIAVIVFVITVIISIGNMSVRSSNWSIGLGSYALTYLLIFGLAIW